MSLSNDQVSKTFKCSCFIMIWVLAFKNIDLPITSAGVTSSFYSHITLFCLSSVVVLFIVLVHKKHSYWKELGVPCSSPTFIVGHVLQRFGITKSTYQFYDDLYINFNGKDFCGFYDFTKPGLVIGNLNLIRNITMKDFDYFSDRLVLGLGKINPIANDMITNAHGSHWKEIRTAISPAFTPVKLRQLNQYICDRASLFTENLSNHDSQTEIEMRQICGQFTMDTIASCAFGIECGALNSDAAEFATMASRIFVLSLNRAAKIIILMMSPRLAEALDSLGVEFVSDEFKFFERVVTDTLARRKKHNIRRGDFLDLMKDTNKMSDTTMTAQAILFLLAGYENTANTLSFAFHLLAVHEDVQEELRQEILNDEQLREGKFDCETIRHLPLLDATVKETLRLYPVAQIVERVCTKDYILPGTNIPVYKGQSIIVPLWCIHRDPNHWKDPNIFKPGRFINSEYSFSYMPFGLGQRKCIGENFAIYTVKVGICKVLLQHRLMKGPNTVDPPPLRPRAVIDMKAINGLPLLIKPLHQISSTN